MIDTVLTLLTVPTNGGFRLKNWAKSPLVRCFAGILVFVSRWSVSVCMVVGFGLYGGVIRLVWWWIRFVLPVGSYVILVTGCLRFVPFIFLCMN